MTSKIPRFRTMEIRNEKPEYLISNSSRAAAAGLEQSKEDEDYDDLHITSTNFASNN